MASDGILKAWAAMDNAADAIRKACAACEGAALQVRESKSGAAEIIARDWEGRASRLRDLFNEINGK